MTSQRHAVEQGYDRGGFGYPRLRTRLNEFILCERFRLPLLRYSDGTLPNRTGMHHILALEQLDVTECIGISSDRLDLCTRQTSEDGMVGDFRNHALLDHLAVLGFYDAAKQGLRLLAAISTSSEPQFCLKGNIILLMLQTVSPVLENPRLFNPVLDSPRPNGMEMLERPFQWSKATRKRCLVVFLPFFEQTV